MSVKMKDVFGFIHEIITSMCFECAPLDGIDVSEKALEVGILYKELEFNFGDK